MLVKKFSLLYDGIDFNFIFKESYMKKMKFYIVLISWIQVTLMCMASIQTLIWLYPLLGQQGVSVYRALQQGVSGFTLVICGMTIAVKLIKKHWFAVIIITTILTLLADLVYLTASTPCIMCAVIVSLCAVQIYMTAKSGWVDEVYSGTDRTTLGNHQYAASAIGGAIGCILGGYIPASSINCTVLFLIADSVYAITDVWLIQMLQKLKK